MVTSDESPAGHYALKNAASPYSAGASSSSSASTSSVSDSVGHAAHRRAGQGQLPAGAQTPDVTLGGNFGPSPSELVMPQPRRASNGSMNFPAVGLEYQEYSPYSSRGATPALSQQQHLNPTRVGGDRAATAAGGYTSRAAAQAIPDAQVRSRSPLMRFHV